MASCSFRPQAQSDAPARLDAAGDAPVDAPVHLFMDGSGGCTPIAVSPGHLTAPSVGTAPAIDGDLSDWSTCFVTLDQATAGQLLDFTGGSAVYVSGRFSVAHDATHVYVAAQATTIAPLGSHALPQNWLNNAVELYFHGSGEGVASGYDPEALQIVVDHADREQAFVVAAPVSTTAGSSAAVLAGDQLTYTAEVSVSPATFGMTELGSSMGFDIVFDNGNGSAQLSQVVWVNNCVTGSACPGASCTQPYCDERAFGQMQLAP